MGVAEKNGTLSWQGQNDVYKGFLWINLWEKKNDNHAAEKVKTEVKLQVTFLILQILSI